MNAMRMPVWLVVGLTGAGVLSCRERGPQATAPPVETPPPSMVEPTPAPPADEKPPDAAAAGDPADAYYRGYLLANSAGKNPNPTEAARLYQEALRHFTEVRKLHPDWKSGMVDGRIERTRSELAALSGKSPGK